MKKKNRHFITLSFITLLLLLLLASYLGVAYENLTSMEKSYNQSLVKENEDEWTFIYSMVLADKSKATLQVNTVKDKIQQDLYTEYSGQMDKLKYDMDNLSSNSKYATILSNDINGKYLNVNNDNNDMFIAELNLSSSNGYPNFTIISDKSINCSIGVRDAKKELSLHANKKLGLDAIQRIVDQNDTDIIFWEFLKSENPKHYIIKSCDVNDLKKVFLTEGVGGLSTYEFCNVAYIKNTKTDIFGTPDVNALGQRYSNYKIVVYQGFNIVDDLKTNYSTEIQSFENNKKALTKSYIDTKLRYTIEIILISVIMFIVFITLVNIQNIMLEIEGENNK